MAVFTLSLNWKSAVEDRDTYWIEEGCSVYINQIEYDNGLDIPMINYSQYENQN